MADESIKIELDHKPVQDSMGQIAEATKKLAETIEDSLGKDAPKSFDKLQKAGEDGTNKLYQSFKNVGTKIKEDLKSAFDMSKIVGGGMVLKGIGAGVSQVLDMEKAFDKLNTRLQLTNKQMDSFKTNVGRRVAATGQSLESVLPGVEAVASKGGMKDTGQLASVAEILGQVKATTGEETGGLAEEVVDMLKGQGKEITASNFKASMDAIQSTRVTGAFKTAGEAAGAIKGITDIISPDKQKKLGLGTGQIGGLVAAASKAGEGGQAILQKILETSTKAGGQALLNSLFGAQLFKSGKLDTKALGQMNKKGLGAYSEQVLAETTGVGQADLARFIDAMKNNQADLSTVANSSNATATQFNVATDNLASSIDQFKEKAMTAGREIGEGFAHLGHSLTGGKFDDAKKDLKNIGTKLWENKGTVGLAAGGALASAVLAGGGMNSLLGKLGGGMLGQGADMAKNIAISKELKAAGVEVQAVMVVNAKEIGDEMGQVSGGAEGGVLKKMGEMLSGAKGFLGQGALAGAKTLSGGLAIAGAGAAGFGVGKMAMDSNLLGIKDITGKATEKLYDFFNKGSEEEDIKKSEAKARENYAKANPHKTLMPVKGSTTTHHPLAPIHAITPKTHTMPHHDMVQNKKEEQMKKVHEALKTWNPQGHTGKEGDDMAKLRAKYKMLHQAVGPGEKGQKGGTDLGVGSSFDSDTIKEAITEGTVAGMLRVKEYTDKNKTTTLTQPSDLSGNRGGKM